MPTAGSQKVRPTRRSAPSSDKDALTLLEDDHKSVEALFAKFEKAGQRAYKTKRGLVDHITEELSVHSYIEEQVLYPAAREEVTKARGDVLEALEEHHVVKWQLNELVGLPAEDERFTAKVTVLIENVRHHVKEEESELFPLLRSAMDRTRLEALGVELEKAKAVAPTRPHPRAPDRPSEHPLAETVATVFDRAKEAVKSVRSTTDATG